MNILSTLAIAVLLGILTLTSYIDRLYSEMGKFLPGEFQENIDVWELAVEPRLGMSRERLALSAALWTQFSLAFLTLCFGALLFAGTSANDRPSAAEIAQAVFGAVLVIVLFNRFLPFVFFTRTRGRWIVRLRLLIRLLFFLMLPATLFLAFLLSIAALAEPPPGKDEDDLNEAAVDALIEAGEEEGIIEKGDRDLVRSAVEFGDKVVREVMTPRPDIFAVSAETTLEEFHPSPQGSSLFQSSRLFRLARSHYRNRLCPRPAADCRQYRPHPESGEHPAAGRLCPRNQAGQ